METTEKRTTIRIKRVVENGIIWYAAYRLNFNATPPFEVFIQKSCFVLGKDFMTEKECENAAIKVAKGETKSEQIVAEFTI